jgi:hypothetical protein
MPLDFWPLANADRLALGPASAEIVTPAPAPLTSPLGA